MKTINRFGVAALLVCALLASRASAQNLFANPGFEEPITSDGPPFIGFWEGFSGGAGASAANSSVNPRSGAMHLDLTINNVDNSFAGVFQDVVVTPGQTAVFEGWHLTTAPPLGLVNELRIEWRNSVSNTEIGRTANFSPVPTATYSPFSISGVVPAGADLGRVVYAIQTFTGTSNTGTVFVDDVSLTVPEPTALSMLGLGAVAILRRRRAR